MKRFITLLLIPLSCLISCNESEDPSDLMMDPPEKPIDLCLNSSLVSGSISNPEEYRIIQAIIKYNYIDDNLIHVAQQSHSVSDPSIFERFFISEEIDLQPETIEEYISLNSSSFFWGDLFEEEQELISVEELDCLFENNDDGWEAYYSKYENAEGYLNFGRPIQEGNRAIVTFTLSCNYLCGSGRTVILTKVNEEWTVQNQIGVFIN
jgi:hypothetical protein